MQVKHLVAALIAVVPMLASAQSSVTIYGIADASIGMEDTGAPNGDRTVVGSGNQSTSRIGFRGVEEISKDLKAVFNFEAGVAVDTGAADTAGLFQRRAVVGLQGSFGTVTVGREYSPLATVAGASDALGQGFYGTNLSAFGAGRMTRRLANSVNYVTPTNAFGVGGLRVLAAYGAGEVATGPSKDLMGIAVDYTNANFYLGAGYQVFENVATGDDKEMMVGGGFKFGPAFEIKTNYVKVNPAGGLNDFEQFNFGGSYTVGANKFFANYAQNKLENGAKGNGYSIAYTYNLSKRTNLYGAYSTTRNNNLGTFGITSAGSSVAVPAANPGSDPTAFAIGVRHSF